ncbi:MAG: hypothetical protein JWQ38_3098 [Flavipsychrobacter sp.]|nr:hypothetical protein [Flavipsychrobacter sp.]
MKAITVEINDISAGNFNDFSPEMKKEVSKEVAALISKMNQDARLLKLKKLVDEINAGDHGMTLNPDIILEFLRVEDE